MDRYWRIDWEVPREDVSVLFHHVIHSSKIEADSWIVNLIGWGRKGISVRVVYE
jgi:hypothetical protein